MIHFFRRIRKSLLEDSKFRKYIIYAIGEIALVMIGILLALQVNNWNEKSMNGNKELAFLQRLEADIAADTLMIGDFLDIVKTKEATLRSIVNGELSNMIYYKRAGTYDLFLTRFQSLPIISDNAYLEITSSGNWSLISDIKLKKQIFNYYRLIRNRNSALENKFSDWPKILSQLMPADGAYDPGYTDDYELSEEQISRSVRSILSERERLVPHINAELQYTVKQKVSFIMIRKEAKALHDELEKILSNNN